MTPEATASELRKTGISAIGDVRWGTHFCYFYETKQDLLDTLVLYFKTGLESKELCLWVVSQLLSVKEAKRALGRAVPDLDRHLAEGDLEIHGHDEWYLDQGRCDASRVLQAWGEKLNQALASGYAGLRASGDGGWNQNGDWMVFREYEKQVDVMIADQRSIILCTYPLTTTPGDQVFDVAHIHQVAVARRNGSWETIEIPELKEAKAKIKRLNEELEQKVEERTRELAATNEALRSEIAERKLAEEAVKRAEDRIRLVIDTIPTMAWSLRPDGVLDFLNQRWLDYTGLSLEEAIEKPTCTVHPDDLSRVMEKWLAVKATSEAYEDEMRLRRADGEYRWFLVRIAPLLDEQGNVAKRYGVAIDIEHRKRAEKALRKSEKLFAVFMDQLPGYAWIKDIEGRYVYVNKKESELGAYRAGVIGKTDAELWPAEIASAYQANDDQVVTTRKAVQTVEPSLADGAQCYMLVSKFPIFDQDGSVVMVAGAGVDITDRIQAEEALRESETKFRRLLASNIIGVVFWTLEGDILDANDLFLNMVGYTREDLRQGKLSWKKLTPPGYAQVDEKAIGELRVTGTSVPFEKEYIRKDGSRVSVLIGSALLEPKKDVGSSFVMDITERKRAAKELEEANRQLRFLSRRLFHLQEEERRHLARELHDEVGQALTAAKINLQTAMKEPDGAKSKRIDETAAILEKLLGQVRQISLDLRPSTLDDLGLVPALRSLLDQQGRRASVAVRFSVKDVPENLNPEIQTTCFRIAQEAITNVVRHANATRIDVELARENGNLRLQVRDNGRGFDADSTQAQAVGLGLIGIKERAALVDAHAKVVSSPNNGTTIEVSLPLTLPPERESR